ncbi:hypothetical protein B0H14DRAFT_2589777 [Mycena olivaceomarginata]|nr:hypothetical protein B0H14DRAFT_2589777 [Mycena olivaceomarginata]
MSIPDTCLTLKKTAALLASKKTHTAVQRGLAAAARVGATSDEFSWSTHRAGVAFPLASICDIIETDIVRCHRVGHGVNCIKIVAWVVGHGGPSGICITQVFRTTRAFLRAYILETAYNTLSITGQVDSTVCLERCLRSVIAKVNVGVVPRTTDCTYLRLELKPTSLHVFNHHVGHLLRFGLLFHFGYLLNLGHPGPSALDLHPQKLVYALPPSLCDLLEIIAEKDHNDNTPDPIYEVKTFKGIMHFITQILGWNQHFLHVNGQMEAQVLTYWVVNGDSTIYTTKEDAAEAWKQVANEWGSIRVTDKHWQTPACYALAIKICLEKEEEEEGGGKYSTVKKRTSPSLQILGQSGPSYVHCWWCVPRAAAVPRSACIPLRQPQFFHPSSGGDKGVGAQGASGFVEDRLRKLDGVFKNLATNSGAKTGGCRNVK